MNLVLVGYTSYKTNAAVLFIERFFSNLHFGRKLLVCNNQDIIPELSLKPDWKIINGGNTFGEFSGWQEGLDELRRSGSNENVLFLNDTVNSHRYFSRFRRWALIRELRYAAPRSIVGFVNHGNNDIGNLIISGLVLPGWVSTFCFCLGSETLERLNYQLYRLEEIEKCIPGGGVESGFCSADISPDLQQHLKKWLFGGGWYRSEPLSTENADALSRKAKLICAEWLLSARCWQAGCNRVDPFERHPLARKLDARAERLLRRSGIKFGEWANHPLPWSTRRGNNPSTG